MLEYRIDNIKVFSPDITKKGSFLVLVGVEKAPPHIMLMVDGFVYDWSVKGPRVKIAENDFFLKLNKKGRSSIFIGVEDVSHAIAVDVFSKTKTNSPDSCLQPISEVLSKSYEKKFVSEPRLIFDLIDWLKTNRIYLKVYGLGDIVQGSFNLKRYTLDDVYKTISNEMKKYA